MSNSVKELINHLANNRNRQAEKTFMSVTDQKVGAAIRAKEPQVAQSMFNKKTQQEKKTNETYQRI